MYVFIFSGESAFRTLSIGVGFSKHPMVHRIGDINPNILVNVLYGSESWMAKYFDFNSLYRENGYLDVQTIENAGHNIHIDQAAKFNEAINQICNLTEENYKIC